MTSSAQGWDCLSRDRMSGEFGMREAARMSAARHELIVSSGWTVSDLAVRLKGSFVLCASVSGAFLRELRMICWCQFLSAARYVACPGSARA